MKDPHDRYTLDVEDHINGLQAQEDDPEGFSEEFQEECDAGSPEERRRRRR